MNDGSPQNASLVAERKPNRAGGDVASFETLKAVFKLVEAAGYDALSDIATAEAAKQATGKLYEHAAFLAALGNGLAHFTVWMHARARAAGAPAPVTH